MFSKNIVAILLSCIVIFASAICSAESYGKPTVAVIPFNDQSIRQGIMNEENSEMIRANVETDIVQTGKFRSLTRTDIQRLLDEIKLNNTALFDPSTAAKYGKMVGAKYLVLGTINGLGTKKGNKYVAHLSLRMIEVETAEIFLAGRGQGQSSSDSFDALEKAAEDALSGERGMLTMLLGRGRR